MFVCECGKKFEKNNSLNAHFSHCLIHRKGKPPIDRFGEKRAWNKGLTKETDERVKKLSIINSGEHHPNWRKHLSHDHKEKLSRSLKGKTGGMRSGSNKWKGQYVFYNDQKIWLDSSWEKKFVDHLISLNIKWVKNTNKWGFKYKFNEFLQSTFTVGGVFGRSLKYADHIGKVNVEGGLYTEFRLNARF